MSYLIVFMYKGDGEEGGVELWGGRMVFANLVTCKCNAMSFQVAIPFYMYM